MSGNMSRRIKLLEGIFAPTPSLEGTIVPGSGSSFNKGSQLYL